MRLFPFRSRRTRDEIAQHIRGIQSELESLRREVSGVRAALDEIASKACRDRDIARVVEEAVGRRLPEPEILDARLSAVEGVARDVAKEVDAAGREARRARDEGHRWLDAQLRDRTGEIARSVESLCGRMEQGLDAAARRIEGRAEEIAGEVKRSAETIPGELEGRVRPRLAVLEERVTTSARDLREDLEEIRRATSRDLAALEAAFSAARVRWEETAARWRARFRAELGAATGLLRQGLADARRPARLGLIGRLLARFVPPPPMGRIAESLAVLEAAIQGLGEESAGGPAAGARAPDTVASGTMEFHAEAAEGQADPASRPGVVPPAVGLRAGPRGRDAHLLGAGDHLDPPDDLQAPPDPHPPDRAGESADPV